MEDSQTIKKYLVDIKQYEKLEKIGGGSYGTVYLVRNLTNKMLYAAKVNDNGKDDEQLEFSNREIEICYQMNSPTIMKLRGISMTDFDGKQNITIIMDYKENGSLQDLLQKAKQGKAPRHYDNTAKQIILIGIAHGMMTLHDKEIIHRDLKPENVLLDSQLKATISDFGLSKFLDPFNSMNQSRVCGSPKYMSPEVLSQVYNRKCDVYSFGILMFEVVTGQQAYSELINDKKMNRFKLLNMVSNGTRPNINTQIKPGIRELIKKCWDQNPDNRPTFEEIFEKLSLLYERDKIESQKNHSDTDNMSSNEDGESIYYKYCLEGVDVKRVFDYANEITNDVISSEQQLIAEQAEKIGMLEQQIEKLKNSNFQTMKDYQKLTKKYNDICEENCTLKILIKSYQQQITDIKRRHQEEIEILESESFESSSPLEGEKNSEERCEVIVQPCISNQKLKQNIIREKIRQFTIPSDVKSIEQDDFSKCDSLLEVIIPISVVSIGVNAFSLCSSLREITIPPSVTTIGNGAFSKCTSLERINLAESITSIGKSAFSDCRSLLNVVLPASVKSIENGAFSDCTSLSYICLSSSLTSIEPYTFCGCISLTSIYIPPNVRSIGICAFTNCSSLRNLEITSTSICIGTDAFSGCKIKSKIKREIINRIRKNLFT